MGTARMSHDLRLQYTRVWNCLETRLAGHRAMSDERSSFRSSRSAQTWGDSPPARFPKDSRHWTRVLYVIFWQ